MKPEKQRRQFFDIYSKNWNLVNPLFDFKDLNTKIHTDFKWAVMCPLCMRVFNSYALDQQSERPLTIEHCPPEELGGKPKILLCKQCNSTTGHSIDIKLMEFLKVQPFNNREAQAAVELKNTTLRSSDLDVRGTFVFKRLDENKFSIDGKIEDDYRKERLDKIINREEFQIIYKPHVTPSAHIVHTALLKIGYLLAFSKFGHTFILNSNYDTIRSQILNPEKVILPTKGVSQNLALPNGFYFVKQPLYAKGILIVFELFFNGKTGKNAVFLNHPHTQDYLFYSELRSHEGNTFKIEKEDFLDIDFLTSAENIVLYLEKLREPYRLDLRKMGIDFL